jgi:hypothetical protein
MHGDVDAPGENLRIGGERGTREGEKYPAGTRAPTL